MNVRLKNGWQLKKLADVASVSFSTVNKKSETGQRQVLLCNYMDVWKNSRIRHGLDFMQSTASDGEIERFRLQRGDVLITKDSETREEIAQPSVVEDIPNDLVLGYHLALIRPKPTQVYGPFLAAQLAVPQFRSQFVRAAAGATRYGLKLESVESATVCLPCLPEQRRIAEVLNAVDATIDATRAVIAQTRRLKTAMLHDLLTHGLPGKKTVFRHAKLGELFVERREKGLDGLPVMSVTTAAGLVRRDSLDRRIESELTPRQHSLVRKGDIAYNMMRMWQGVFGFAECDCLISPAYVVVTPKAKIYGRYAAYLFEHPMTIHLFHLYSQGVVDDRLRLYFDQFRTIPVRIPVSKKQQVLIADMLVSIDQRIETEETRLPLLLQVKNALSHVLLTGAKRIPKRGKNR